jgi:hypothetical protein
MVKYISTSQTRVAGNAEICEIMNTKFVAYWRLNKNLTNPIQNKNKKLFNEYKVNDRVLSESKQVLQ